MEFSDILEKWASAHPEIKHVKAKDSKNKRVFYTKGFADMADFLQVQTAKTSPCVIMESSAPVSGNGGDWEYKDYTIYFCVRSPQMMQTMDGEEAKECKEKATILAQTFRNSIFFLNGFLKGKGIPMHIEEGYQIETLGPVWNWWYAAQLTLQIAEGVNKCLGKELADEIMQSL